MLSIKFVYGFLPVPVINCPLLEKGEGRTYLFPYPLIFIRKSGDKVYDEYLLEHELEHARQGFAGFLLFVPDGPATELEATKAGLKKIYRKYPYHEFERLLETASQWLADEHFFNKEKVKKYLRKEITGREEPLSKEDQLLRDFFIEVFGE